MKGDIYLNINWYPGHMAKAKRLISENLKLVDIILEIRDARIPISSANPDLEDLFSGKMRIVFLNKRDMADPFSTQRWVEWFDGHNIQAIPVNSLSSVEAGHARNAILKAAEGYRKNILERKGIRKTVRGMVVGIPNVGKSAFINGVAQGKKAKTGNRPGITKGKQWIRVNPYMELLDTPGLLWPKLEDQGMALNLAYTRTIKEEILDTEEIAHYFLEKAKEDFPQIIIDRYEIPHVQGKGYEILQNICTSKGWIQSGGVPDTSRGARHVLDDFQGGRLGQITLELPS